MKNIDIIRKINEILHTATALLAGWLKKALPRITDNWWDECVWSKLSYGQQDIAASKSITNLEGLDLAALLRIADKNWYAMREFMFLPNKERDCIHDMQMVRNNWAHCGGTLPNKEEILKDLNVILAFVCQLNCDYNISNDIEQFIIAIEKSDVTNNIVASKGIENADAMEREKTEIKERDIVYVVADPTTTGMVFSVIQIGDTIKYDVFVNGAINTYYSGQIALKETKSEYNWVDIATFQSYISAFQLNNPSSKNLYSLNSARIDFVPYQFRPALKLIKADAPRILIADSVGVGKTIEAGLIIKELEARNPLERVMIICPKSLVSERKWELEMKRFDEDFIPLTGADLRQIISDTDRDREWPNRYGKVIVPYSILDSVAYEGEDSKKKHSIGLSNLDPAPHFDLIIIDEAHHIRNGSMDKDKAFAYKCVKCFCDNADAVVMLTATPLQNSDDDLYTLLNVLRPDIVIDKPTFRLMAKPNAYITRCSQIVRAAKDNWQIEALQELEDVSTTEWGLQTVCNNPLYERAMAKLRKPNLSREERVALINDIEALHSFNYMLNRTRRKDIQDFCVRRSHTLETEFTEHQKRLHDELLSFERFALSVLHDARSVPFMMSMIRRQAASCIFGLAPFIKDLLNRRFEQLLEDPEIDFDEISPNNQVLDELKLKAQNIIALAESLPEEDPKFDSVLEVINLKQKEENNKIILFSTFRHTLAYVKRKLENAGVRVGQIDGSVKDDARIELRNRFKLDKRSPEALDVLLFTEVGSEGLDYQFCNMMVNYDLPWNPMRIEQRIGRIDRRGQLSEVVNIYNVITSDTVDADIYERCLMRIGVFERSIGECEEILGEIGTKIEKIALDTQLTDEERCAKLEKMADNEIMRVQELSRLEEEEKGLFGFDLSSYTISKELQESDNPWISPKYIQLLVQRYLNSRLGEGSYLQGNGELKNLRISLADRTLLKEDFKVLNATRSAINRNWEFYLKGNNPNLSVTFDQETAAQNSKAQFLTAVHPLVRQAARYYKQTMPVYVRLKYTSDDIPKGEYPFSIYLWNYLGLTNKTELKVICAQRQIVEDWNEIVMNSSAVCGQTGNINKSLWANLERQHIQLWKEGKESHKKDVQINIQIRVNSLTSSFNIKQKALEQKIADSMDGSIRTMYQSQYEAEAERHLLQIEEIKKKENSADIDFTLIAHGIVVVE